MTTNSESNLTRLAEIIAEEIQVPLAAITPDQTLKDDLDIDSLSWLSILTHIEDEFKVNLLGEPEIDQFHTVADLLERLAPVTEMRTPASHNYAL
jgi:acyl carrier protein